MENPKHMENTLASSSGTVSPEVQDKSRSPDRIQMPVQSWGLCASNRDWWPCQVSSEGAASTLATCPTLWVKNSTMRKNSRVLT